MKLIKIKITKKPLTTREINNILMSKVTRLIKIILRKESDTMPKKPCIGCVYFGACGSTTRTEPCKGRQTKSEKKKGAKQN